jgi:hypothetical protein
MLRLSCYCLKSAESLPERAALSTLMTSTVRYARSRFRWLVFRDAAAGLFAKRSRPAWQRRAAVLRGDLAGPWRLEDVGRPAVFGPAALARVLGAPSVGGREPDSVTVVVVDDKLGADVIHQHQALCSPYPPT